MIRKGLRLAEREGLEEFCCVINDDDTVMEDEKQTRSSVLIAEPSERSIGINVGEPQLRQVYDPIGSKTR